MNVKIFKDGKEIDIKELDINFAKEFFKDNPFGDLIMKTLELAKKGVKENTNLFKEDLECSGNPLTCPLCGEDYLSNFEEALEALKNGKRVTRKLWIEDDKEVYLYFVKPAIYPSRTEAAKTEFGDEVPYSGYFALRTELGYVTPYNFQHADLLAEDWLIINKQK